MRLLGTLTAALALCLGLAAPAAAGGPTMVLLLNPGSGEAAALYATSPQYEELEKAIGPAASEEPAPGPEAPGSVAAGFAEITVNWMRHDMSTWQVDRIYMESDLGILVHRQKDFPQNGEPDPPTSWFPAAESKRLHEILAELGVTGENNDQGFNAPRFPVRAGEAGPEQSPAPITDWWRALPGLAAGAALAVGVPHALGRWRAHRAALAAEPGPKRQLVDGC